MCKSLNIPILERVREMNPENRIPRTRGGICGVLLILLGLWAGLGPFVGPYVHFGYTPDATWHYSLGRLYFSIIGAGAAVLGGLLAAGTRHRGVGIFGGLLAALGGIWLIGGHEFMTVVLQKSYAVGVPIIPAGLAGHSLSVREYLETIALFTGAGMLILLLGAITMGRFSMIAAQDLGDSDGYYADFPAAQSASQPDVVSYPAATTTGQFPAATTGQFPAVPSRGPFSDAPTQYPSDGS
jgi:hypothetical protein